MPTNTKLLVVDDEPQNIQIMREILSFHPKYEYQVAMSGEDALKILETYFPDIILLDIMMPGVDGYEVCKKIRKGGKHRYSKIIMISGRSMIGDRLQGYSAGADDYITKPFVEDELLAKLEVFSQLSRMEELDQLKTTALNILGHETRTPLNGIILGSELLRDMPGLPRQAQIYVEMIRESGMRIQGMVEKISRYWAIRDGIHLNFSSGRIDVLLQRIADKYQQGSPRVKTILNTPSDFSFVADWELLAEGLNAILDNAVKTTPEGGEVEIEYKCDATHTYLLFKDQGPGIDPAICERVFDGLYSADILHHTKGIGLSLAIAKEIIEVHAGRILCRNRTERGTVFEVILKNRRV